MVFGEVFGKEIFNVLEELKKDGVVFDGKDMFILRKYALRLKIELKIIILNIRMNP